MMLKIAYVALKISFHAIVFRSASHVTQLHDFFSFCSLCQFTFSLFILKPVGILIFRTLPLFFVTLIILSDHVMSVFCAAVQIKEQLWFLHFWEKLFSTYILRARAFLLSLFLAIIINIHERRLLLSFLQFYSGNKRRIASGHRVADRL